MDDDLDDADPSDEDVHGMNSLRQDPSEWKLLQKQMDVGSLIKKGNDHRKQSDDFEEVKVELVDDRGKQVAHTKMNQAALSQIEDCGYPHEYIIDSIRTEQLNHVTAFYNLIITKFEY
jgi:hypothetical protein